MDEVWDALSEIRDRTPYSARNTSKGALVEETFKFFQAVHEGLPLQDARKAIIEDNILNKATFETRRAILKSLNFRYISGCPEWASASLAEATSKGIQSPEFLSLAYLYYVLRDRITYEFVIGPVWERWKSGLTNISSEDFLRFMDELAEQEEHIRNWHESSRRKLASNTLSALRDFGLLKGKAIKSIQRMPVADEAVFHLLCILYAEGRRGNSLIDAEDWRIFLWQEAAVADALHRLSQNKWISFEKVGRTTILQIERKPTVRGG